VDADQLIIGPAVTQGGDSRLLSDVKIFLIVFQKKDRIEPNSQNKSN